MARRRAPEPPPIEVRQLTAVEIDRGIEKLRRRISEVEALGSEQVRYDDTRRRNVESNVCEAIRGISLERIRPNFTNMSTTQSGVAAQ